MIINIPQDSSDENIVLRFRDVENLIHGVTFAWRWVREPRRVMATFSLDERQEGDSLIQSRGRIPVETILLYMEPNVLKLAIQNCILYGDIRKVDTIAGLIDSFSWVRHPADGVSWWDIHNKVRRGENASIRL